MGKGDGFQLDSTCESITSSPEFSYTIRWESAVPHQLAIQVAQTAPGHRTPLDCGQGQFDAIFVSRHGDGLVPVETPLGEVTRNLAHSLC